MHQKRKKDRRGGEEGEREREKEVSFKLPHPLSLFFSSCVCVLDTEERESR